MFWNQSRMHSISCTMIFVIFLLSSVCASWDCPNETDLPTIQDFQLAVIASEAARNGDENEPLRMNLDDSKYDNIRDMLEKFQITVVEEESVPNNLFDTSVRAIVAEGLDTVIVAFRHTTTKEQLFQQIIDTVSDLGGVEMTIKGRTVQVNPYFDEGLKLLMKNENLANKMKDPLKRYIITGHSLGAAMASLFSLKMTEDNEGSVWENPRSVLITFGQPRVGNKDFAKLHDDVISTWRKFRFIHNADFVTVIPPKPLYYHHSRAFFIGETIFPFLKRTVFSNISRTERDNTMKRKIIQKGKETSNNVVMAFHKKNFKSTTSNKTTQSKDVLMVSKHKHPKINLADNYMEDTSIGNHTKRFFRKKLWRVCGEGEQRLWHKKLKLSFYKDHDLDGYEEQLFHPPKQIQNRYKIYKDSLADAIRTSC